MKKVVILLYVTLGLLIMSEANTAAADTETTNPVFQDFDSDKDGKVDQEEFMQDMEEDAFNKIDRDDDKVITQEEWNSIERVTDKEKHREIFTYIDKNNDKRISFLEFADYADKHSNLEDSFIRFDKNKNGSLSPNELPAKSRFRLFTIHF
ncbi:hypothetical protein EP227_06465 [bacterium]|nr:MAG: hypothetical protein EP227_06465 [bacterium]